MLFSYLNNFSLKNIVFNHFLSLFLLQKNMLPQAANAAFTFLVANPNHSTMQGNLKFYSTLPEVDVKEIINYEAAVSSNNMQCKKIYHMPKIL
jgi:hypothetical protein